MAIDAHMGHRTTHAYPFKSVAEAECYTEVVSADTVGSTRRMSHLTGLRSTLKRGALVSVANWPVVIVQFIAQSIFTLLLVVFASASAVVLRLVVREDGGLADRDLRGLIEAAFWSLRDQPLALALFLLACAVVILGGAAFTFVVKAGTTSIVIEANRQLGDERAVGRETPFQRAGHASSERLLTGMRRFGPRFLRLGGLRLAGYAVTFGAYGLAIVAGGRWLDEARIPLGWPLVAILTSVLVVWVTVLNLAYQLAQMVITVRDIGVRESLNEVAAFVYVRCPEVLVVFAVTSAAVVTTWLIAIVAMALLGFIWFVPLIGLVVVPLQVIAWFLRDLIFQYVGQTATVCYAHLFLPATPAGGAASARPLRSVS